MSPRPSEDALLVSSMKSESDSPNRRKSLHKAVSFSELSQFFAPSHTVEEVWGIRAESCVVDMIPDDEEIDRKGITRVDFTAMDKTSVAAEFVPANQGEKAFSMDLVFQKLLDLQLSQGTGGETLDGNDNETIKGTESHNSDLLLRRNEPAQNYVSSSQHVSINMAVKLALEANSPSNSNNQSKNTSGSNTVSNSNNTSTKNLMMLDDGLLDYSMGSSRESLESPLSPLSGFYGSSNETIRNSDRTVSVATTTTTTAATTTTATTTSAAAVVVTNDNQLIVEGTLSAPTSSSPSSSGIPSSDESDRHETKKTTNNNVSVVPNLFLHEALNIPQQPDETPQNPTEPSSSVNEAPVKKKKSVRMHFADDDNDDTEKNAPIVLEPSDPNPPLSLASAAAASVSSSSCNNIKSTSFQVSETNHNDRGENGVEN